MKLTKTQLSVLYEMRRDGRFKCVPEYKPARKLVELKLAEEHYGRLGEYWIEPIKEHEG